MVSTRRLADGAVVVDIRGEIDSATADLLRTVIIDTIIKSAIDPNSAHAAHGRRGTSQKASTMTSAAYTPLEKGSISFEATEGQRTSSGAVVSGGNFTIPAAHGLPEGKYRAEWIAPATGKVRKVEELETDGGLRDLTSPLYVEDIAVRVTRREK